MKASYEAYKEYAERELEKRAKVMYPSADVIRMDVKKENRKLDGIQIRRTPSENVCPIIYVQDMYARYLKSEDFSESISWALTSYENALEKASQILELQMANELAREKVLNQLVAVVVNKEANEELLTKVPHKIVNDQAILYRCQYDKSEENIVSSILTNDMVEKLKLPTGDELHNRALESSAIINPPMVRRMSEILGANVGGTVEDDVLGLTVITNDCKLKGAAVMYYDGVLDKLSQKLDDDLIILPSSIHEVLALPAAQVDSIEKFGEIVESANREVVLPEERLSNNVYRYDRKEKALTIVYESDKRIIDMQSRSEKEISKIR